MQAISMTVDEQVIPQEKEHLALAWLVTLTASFFFFYAFIQLNLFNAIDVHLMQSFQLNAAELGQLSSLYFYANALLLFPAGILLDRYSTRKILLFAVVLTTVGTFLFGLADLYLVAAIGRFMVGAGAAFCFLSCIRIATRWFPPNKMAFVTGIIVTMAMIGGLVAQTPMALLSEMIGWRQAVLLDAGLGVVVLIAVALFVQDYPPNSHAKFEAQQTQLKSLGFWKSIRLVLLNPQNWFGGIYTALLNLPVFLLGALWGIHYLMQAHHVSLLQASYATTLLFVGVIVGSPFFGWMSDHMGRRVLPMIIGAIASLAVMLALMYIPDLSLGAILFLFFLIGFVTSSQVLSYPAVAELNPITLTSTAMSVISFTIMFSGVVFQPLFGWLMELHWDHSLVDGVPAYAPSDMLNAMMIMPIAFIIGFFISLMMKETHCQAQESR